MAKRRRKPQKDWNLTMVRARQAQKLMPKKANGAINWGSVDVAQIDTGYLPHPVFGFGGGKKTYLRVHDGRNYQEIDKPNDPLDPMDYKRRTQQPGHGTRIGSVICGLPQDGLFDGGVAPGLPLIPYRATNTVILQRPIATKREIANVSNAIVEAIKTNMVDVINISLGGPGWFFLPKHLGEAVDFAYEHGVIICAAAGQVTDRVTYPGKYYRTICCGGIDADKTSWNTADHGYSEYDLVHIDVWAPANHINRPELKLDSDNTYLHDTYAQADSYEQKGSGTSYATAHVTAAAAMWIRLHEKKIDEMYRYQPWMRVEAFRKLIKDTHIEMTPGDGDGNVSPYPGTGILNIERLLNSDLPEPGELEKEERLSSKMYA